MSLAALFNKNPETNPGQIVKTKCDSCWWRISGTTACEAFPGGIPIPILVGVFDHSARYVTEEYDDEGITYRKAPKTNP